MWIDVVAPSQATGELTVAYFSYANRLVMGLGLVLEPGFEATCRPDVPEI
jgi:hypothetical protein